MKNNNNNKFVIYVLSNDLETLEYKYKKDYEPKDNSLNPDGVYFECKKINIDADYLQIDHTKIKTYIETLWEITVNSFDFVGSGNDIMILTKDYDNLKDIPNIKLDNIDVKVAFFQTMHQKFKTEKMNVHYETSKADNITLTEEKYLAKLEDMIKIMDKGILDYYSKRRR